MTTVRFLDSDCTLKKGRYANGRVALSLVDDEGPVATATVNLDHVTLGRDEVLVKDYAENRGMMAALEAAGVVKPTDRTVKTGFVDIPVCELQPPFREPTHAEAVELGRGKGRIR